jgi:hypothetical protein
MCPHEMIIKLVSLLRAQCTPDEPRPLSFHNSFHCLEILCLLMYVNILLRVRIPTDVALLDPNLEAMKFCKKLFHKPYPQLFKLLHTYR